MKTLRVVTLIPVGFVVAVFLYFTPAAPAAPRPSWVGLIPEVAWPLYRESFDEVFFYGMTNAQVTVGNYTLVESWSGYALQRSGASSVTPFFVPAADSGHTNIYCDKGMIRFWFKPDWSSVTQTKEAGPGRQKVE